MVWQTGSANTHRKSGSVKTRNSVFADHPSVTDDTIATTVQTRLSVIVSYNVTNSSLLYRVLCLTLWRPLLP